MGSSLSIYCTKRRENPANFVTSRKINTRLACPIEIFRFLRVRHGKRCSKVWSN